MNTLNWKRVGLRLISGLATCLLATGLYAQSPESVGIVRVSDQSQQTHPMQTQSRAQRIQQTSLSRGSKVDANRGYLMQPAPYGNSEMRDARTGNPVVDLIRTASASSTTSVESHPATSCPSCQSGNCGSSGCRSCGGGCGYGNCDSCDSDSNFNRFLKDASHYQTSLLHRLFGYFIPDGCCGQGCPTFGHYNLSYSANPRYFDPRDGRVYAAEGYNIPMAVPLAPNVRHTYNYGWGIPSSRRTPISTRAPF